MLSESGSRLEIREHLFLAVATLERIAFNFPLGT